MQKYDKNRHCPKCDYSKTKDRWDYWPTKKEYDDNRALKNYETTPLVRRVCQNLSCDNVWYELPTAGKIDD